MNTAATLTSPGQAQQVPTAFCVANFDPLHVLMALVFGIGYPLHGHRGLQELCFRTKPQEA